MSNARRYTRADQAAYKKFRDECEARNEPCWICGQDIDYNAPAEDYKNPSRFQRDHKLPVATHPELEHDPSNWAASHAGCNREKADKAPRPALGSLSEAWV